MANARRWMIGIATLSVALSGVVASVAPAQAVPGRDLIGHRCRIYPAERTNENTVAALLAIRRVDRVWCEIDAWTIADGTVIVWHDATWRRVADHSTLPEGVEPGSRVEEATWAQVREIRTKGGERVPTLGRMINVSGAERVPLLVEVKNRIEGPASMVERAAARGARVRYYKPWEPECQMTALEEMRDAGAPIGLKVGSLALCPRTPAELQAMGVSLVSLPVRHVTPEYTGDLNSHGISAFSRGVSESNVDTVLANGAARVLVNHPAAAATW